LDPPALGATKHGFDRLQIASVIKSYLETDSERWLGVTARLDWYTSDSGEVVWAVEPLHLLGREGIRGILVVVGEKRVTNLVRADDDEAPDVHNGE
jgi:hypothetical protein